MLKGGHRIGLVLVAGLAMLTGCGSGSSPTFAGSGSLTELEDSSYRLVNAEREANGVSPQLERDPVLDEIARQYSQLMRDEGFFSHTSPSGLTVEQRLSAKAFPHIAAAENIARVENASDPAAYAHSLLMRSPGHRENILNGKYLRVGIGAAVQGKTIWITQLFVEPLP